MDQARHLEWLDSLQSKRANLLDEATIAKFLTKWPKLIEVLTECFICSLVGGEPSADDTYDVLTPQKQKLEVKFARLRTGGKKGQPTGTRRWVWDEVFGIDGEKCYDHLVLLGQSDSRQPDQAESPFVIFYIPFDEVQGLCGQRKGEANRIGTTSARAKIRKGKPGIMLFEKYRVTEKNLQEKCHCWISSERPAV